MHRNLEHETYARDRAEQARAAERPRQRVRTEARGRRLAALSRRGATGAMWVLLLLLTLAVLFGTFVITEGARGLAGNETIGQKIDHGIGRINAMFAGTGEGIQDRAQATRQAIDSRVDAAHETVSDAAITASIKTDLLKDPYLSAARVEVKVDGGVVTLRGSAGSDTSRERAGRMAGAVAGVKQVNNELTVAPATAAR